MSQKKSGVAKNIVLLLIVVACGVGAWYFVSQRNAGGGAMGEAAVQDWFESGDMAEESLDLEGVKARLRHDAPQDLGEDRYRFDMRHVDSSNTLVVDVVIRGGRAISFTIIEPAS